MATQAEIEAAKELSAFCKTAPGRLPERITNAMAVVDALDSQQQPVNSKMLCFDCCGLCRWRSAECGTLEAQSCQQCGDKSYLREVNVTPASLCFKREIRSMTLTIEERIEAATDELFRPEEDKTNFVETLQRRVHRTVARRAGRAGMVVAQRWQFNDSHLDYVCG